MDNDIAKLVIDGATCIAAVALAFVTWQLVRVTRHHARSAERMAAAADRLGEILDRQAAALAEVAEASTLVSAIGSLGKSHPGHFDTVRDIISELVQHRKGRQA